jgi:hypothetical protein
MDHPQRSSFSSDIEAFREYSAALHERVIALRLELAQARDALALNRAHMERAKALHQAAISRHDPAGTVRARDDR